MSDLDDMLTPEEAAPLAGVTASTLRRAARRGNVPGLVVHRRGRWELTRAGALAYGAQERRRGRPASAGLEVETYPPAYRARVGERAPWSYSATREGAIRAAHAAARRLRLADAQRPVLDRWWGLAQRPVAQARPPLRVGDRVVIRRRGRELRAVVLDVSRSGRVTVGWVGYGAGDRVRVVGLAPAAVLEEVGP